MDFSNFIFQFKTFKINKKMTKSILIFAQVPRGCVALRATWQCHAGPRGVRIFIFILYTLYSRGIQPCVDRKGIRTL